MSAKYEFMNEIKLVNGITLRRIRRIGDGVAGGYLQKESNLSQSGLCFLHDGGEAYDDCLISDDAQVYGLVHGNAKISGNAVVRGEAYDEALITDNSELQGRAYGRSIIRGNARVLGEVFGDAVVEGSAVVYGRASGTAHVSNGVMMGDIDLPPER